MLWASFRSLHVIHHAYSCLNEVITERAGIISTEEEKWKEQYILPWALKPSRGQLPFGCKTVTLSTYVTEV